MKTLKYEEVHRQEYHGLEQARACIEHFLMKVYNQKRLHSALQYCPPVEFERSLMPSPSSENRPIPKNEGALECVFQGIAESINPMWAFVCALYARYKLGPGYRLPTASRLPGDPVRGQDHPPPASPAALRARTKLKDLQEEHALAIIVLMSSGPANPRSGCSPAEPTPALAVLIDFQSPSNLPALAGSRLAKLVVI